MYLSNELVLSLRNILGNSSQSSYTSRSRKRPMGPLTIEQWLALPSSDLLAALPQNIEALHDLSSRVLHECRARADAAGDSHYSQQDVAVASAVELPTAVHELLELEILNRQNKGRGKKAVCLIWAARRVDFLRAQQIVALQAQNFPYTDPTDALDAFEHLVLGWTPSNSLDAMGMHWSNAPRRNFPHTPYLDGVLPEGWESMQQEDQLAYRLDAMLSLQWEHLANPPRDWADSEKQDEGWSLQ